jgi:hypothetical protein
MEKEPKIRILIRPGDRFLLILLCLIFVVGFGSTYVAIYLWRPDDTFGKVLKFLGEELNTTLLLFTALVAARCCVSRPALERKLASTALKVLISMMLIGCAVASLIILALLHTL